MNILFIAPQPFYADRGTPIAVRATVEALASQGHTIDMAVYHAGDDIRIPGVRIFRAPRPPLVKKVPIGPSWQKILCDIGLHRTAASLARSGRYDIIHALEEGVFMARRIGRRLGIPYVYEMESHMSEQLSQRAIYIPASWVFARLESAAMRDAAGVLAVCDAIGDIARRHTAAPVHVVTDAPPPWPDSIEPDPEVLAAPGVRILYTGNLEHYQGVELLLAAFERLASRVQEATLLIVGGDPASIRRLSDQYEPLVRRGRVRFLGQRPMDSLPAMLVAADILASPRLRGLNTPLKVYSYMCAGRAILATDLPTNTQALTPDAAMLAAPTPEAMETAMQRLIEDPALRARYGRRAHELMESTFSRRAFDQRMADFYSLMPVVPRKPPPATAREPLAAGSGNGAAS